MEEKSQGISLLERDLQRISERVKFEEERFGEFCKMYQFFSKDLGWILENKCEGADLADGASELEIGIALMWRAYERVRKEADDKYNLEPIESTS